MVERAFARVGLELELLAPRGRTRVDVARALARRFGGHVEHGFKYYSEGKLLGGRPLCRLSHAARVVERGGRVLVAVVDDNTIREGLGRDGRGTPAMLHAADDVRFALLAERVCWSRRGAVDSRLAPLASLLGGSVEEHGVLDAYGHPVVVATRESAARARVCELVTRPLAASERGRVVTALLDEASRLRLTVPAEAGLHAHYDAGPWRSTRALRRLILESAARRDEWAAALRPNPRCRKLGPFPPDVVRVAREGARVAFPTFAAALQLAGLHRSCDLNLLGVVERHPRHATLEVRCLPMSLGAADVLRSLATVEALLGAVLARVRPSTGSGRTDG